MQVRIPGFIGLGCKRKQALVMISTYSISKMHASLKLFEMRAIESKHAVVPKVKRIGMPQ
jgi:hypothetical protein